MDRSSIRPQHRHCAGCHLTTFQRTTNPNHATAGFPATCTTCHTTAAWTGARFDHNTATRFRLTGKHTTTNCSQCHVNNRFAGTPATCAGCHLARYQSTTNPNHAAAGFPADCSLCHTTTQWPGATFNHSTTRFPLTGKHTSTQCAQCHINNRFAGTPLDCASCHLAVYQRTTNPNHASAGFPQDCKLCHSTSQWLGATFNHSTTRFPLTGKHTTTQCALCHVGGRFTGTPMDCNSCHSAAFNATTNPNHAGAGFPRTCDTCHTTARWTGATFTHRFPITTGAHKQGTWSTCGDCHTNPANYQVFSCLGCHEHEKTRMDQKHREQRNYVYNSANCYSCHPNGKH
jgi:hypothetical protein